LRTNENVQPRLHETLLMGKKDRQQRLVDSIGRCSAEKRFPQRAMPVSTHYKQIGAAAGCGIYQFFAYGA
jgi:hypothetical protein